MRRTEEEEKTLGSVRTTEERLREKERKREKERGREKVREIKVMLKER